MILNLNKDLINKRILPIHQSLHDDHQAFCCNTRPRNVLPSTFSHFWIIFRFCICYINSSSCGYDVTYDSIAFGYLRFPAPGPSPRPQFVFDGPGPKFVFHGPSPQFMFACSSFYS